ncbi:MAG: type II toxin-antitoxin system HigB family toxin [Bacteroidetes bacterium]|nr:type II toxin-antitoxin system HigB family toxin [Bacteroidota bacterium]
MKVNIIRKQSIEDYEVTSNSRKSFEDWVNKALYADWNSTNDIKKTFGSADILGENCHRIVFNIAGNNYRMICKYKFRKIVKNKKPSVHLFVCWIGTHAEYDELCARRLQYTINLYKK